MQMPEAVSAFSFNGAIEPDATAAGAFRYKVVSCFAAVRMSDGTFHDMQNFLMPCGFAAGGVKRYGLGENHCWSDGGGACRRSHRAACQRVVNGRMMARGRGQSFFETAEMKDSSRTKARLKASGET